MRGEGIVKFILPEMHCAYHKYKIELRLVNKTDELSCKNFDVNSSVEHPHQIFDIHSDREYYTNITSGAIPDDSQLCSQVRHYSTVS